MDEEDSSYLDYEAFLDPSFSPASFANTLVLATNNATDSPLDLKTPLSRVQFDVQEVDGHIGKLTDTSALPLLDYTKDNVQASDRILQELESQVAILTGSYERLEREVIARHEAAEATRLASERLWETVRLGRAVARCMTLGRQLEAQMAGFKVNRQGGDSKEDNRVMIRGANTILSLRQAFSTAHAGGEGEDLDKITVVRSLRTELIEPAEKNIMLRAEQIISQFSMSSLTAQNGDSTTPAGLRSASTYAQTEDTRTRATSALISLYLLSPVPSTPGPFEASYLVAALQEYLRRAITSSLAGLTSALAALPKLERTLIEVSARCQNIVALEMLLESIKPPTHPLLDEFESGATPSSQREQPREPANLLQPVLHSLDTSSLPSYFWRSMASQLSSRVQRILKDGGVSARTLRSNREKVRDSIRECVNKGSQLPASSLTRGKGATVGNWEREAAVMVGSVMNVLGR